MQILVPPGLSQAVGAGTDCMEMPRSPNLQSPGKKKKWSIVNKLMDKIKIIDL
jgi:hypothetical protein